MTTRGGKKAQGRARQCTSTCGMPPSPSGSPCSSRCEYILEMPSPLLKLKGRKRRWIRISLGKMPPIDHGQLSPSITHCIKASGSLVLILHRHTHTHTPPARDTNTAAGRPACHGHVIKHACGGAGAFAGMDLRRWPIDLFRGTAGQLRDTLHAVESCRFRHACRCRS